MDLFLFLNNFFSLILQRCEDTLRGGEKESEGEERGREGGREGEKRGEGEEKGRERWMEKDKVSNNDDCENFFVEWSMTSTTNTHLEFLHLGLCVLQVFLQR